MITDNKAQASLNNLLTLLIYFDRDKITCGEVKETAQPLQRYLDENRWHDVKKELPDGSQHILVQTGDSYISHYCYYNKSTNTFIKAFDDETEIQYVVAWKYMPEISENYHMMDCGNGC